MPERRLRARGHGWGSLGVAAVLALSMVLFAANARLAGGVDARQPQDLAGLLDAEEGRVAELQEEVDELLAEVDALTAVRPVDLPEQDAATLELTAVAAGRVAVTGPGVVVRLWDAEPARNLPSWVTNDDLVVHQQDLEAVINALWAGGAEAMTLQGERVIATSAFRCVGNVLRLHGRLYSPPYEVQAIGDPDALLEALDDSTTVQVYLDYADRLGLGWSADDAESLTLPAYAGEPTLNHARVPDDVDVLGDEA
ncbi:DUF881 domain-containing protein [Actinotalea fermentans]|uniref:DUF881 domain-containing protein n=1 Tax=Actinotalea fermentans TaxID=43671 RepID=A0A511Z282_9CELL|nr:DUF881 domain-containing protein [Actinotalea fermentans]KGM16115.1 hypothetical protein N867_03045 [Actinotalea fermentans ATCC 43279 = JCM 9966 = DSM 3133]GEN81506.1 hypothetical protein AFE02nite_32400 [Actinotalea fermentans]